jgi:hypothetical protein
VPNAANQKQEEPPFDYDYLFKNSCQTAFTYLMTLAVDDRWMLDDSNHSSRVQGKQERGKRQCFMTISALFHHPPVCYSSNNIKLSKIQQKNAKLL